MRRKLSGDALLGIGALLLVIVLSLARASQQRETAVSAPSSYDTGRYGYRVLYDMLRREHVPVARFTQNHHFLGGGTGTLVLAQSPFDAAANRAAGISRNDVLNLKEWVRRGGALVVLAPPYGGEYDTLLGIPASKHVGGAQGAAHPFARFASTAGVLQVAGNFSDAFALDASQKAVPLLETRGGIVALRYHLGDGTVLVFTDPTIFSNATIALDGNARFAVQLFAGLPAPVAFDETIHGYAEQQSLWNALPPPVRIAVMLAAVALLLGIAGNLWRFAPPLAPERLSEPDSSAYITSMANLLQRAHATGKALRDDADSALRAVRRTCGLSDRAKIATVLGHLQDPHQRQAVLELDRLRDLEKPSDAELLRAGVLSSHLRKEFSK